MQSDPWLLTVSGKKYHLLQPDAERSPVSIRDVAHALSRIQRFTGHTNSLEGWTVGQHSLLCHWLTRRESARVQISALLHDSTEAYLGDIATPLKQLLPEYRALEATHHENIRAQLSLPTLSEAEKTLVKQADLEALATERALFMLDHPDWPGMPTGQAAMDKAVDLARMHAQDIKRQIEYLYWLDYTCGYDGHGTLGCAS